MTLQDNFAFHMAAYQKYWLGKHFLFSPEVRPEVIRKLDYLTSDTLNEYQSALLDSETSSSRIGHCYFESCLFLILNKSLIFLSRVSQVSHSLFVVSPNDHDRL